MIISSIEKLDNKQSILRFQSNFILPIARFSFLFLGGVGALALVSGLAVALFISLSSLGGPDKIAVTPTVDVPFPSADLSLLDVRLNPPKSIRFVVANAYFDKPFSSDKIIGHFEADSVNDLAKYPDDFQIIGGKDYNAFQRVQLSSRKSRTALTLTKESLEKLNATRNAMTKLETSINEFVLQVVARDVFGNISEPEEVVFQISYGYPKDIDSQESAVKSESPTPISLSALQKLANEIAVAIEPEKNLAYYDLYKLSETVPGKCGTVNENTEFISTYRTAFEYVKPRLNSSNVHAFYVGVCDTWAQKLAKQKDEQALEDAKRRSALAKNQKFEQEHNSRLLKNHAIRSAGLIVAGGGFSAILLISLALATLASENHAKVMRELTTATRALEASVSAQSKAEAKFSGELGGAG